MEFKRILITSEKGWGEISEMKKVVEYIFHDLLDFSDTLGKNSERCEKYKNYKQTIFYKKKEQMCFERAKRKDKRKKGESLKDFQIESKELKEIQKEYENKVQKYENSIVKNNIIISIRDRNADTLVRNSIYNIGYRVVQFRADWFKTENAGLERNIRMFNSNLDVMFALVFTKWKNENDGLDHFMNICENENVPLLIIDNYDLKFKSFREISFVETEIIPKIEKEIYTEEMEKVFKIPKKGTKEYYDLIEKSMKIKRYFYQGKKTEKIKYVTPDEMLESSLKKKKNVKKQKKTKKNIIKENKLKNTRNLEEEYFSD